jgi:hypothetical protein
MLGLAAPEGRLSPLHSSKAKSKSRFRQNITDQVSAVTTQVLTALLGREVNLYSQSLNSFMKEKDRESESVYVTPHFFMGCP